MLNETNMSSFADSLKKIIGRSLVYNSERENIIFSGVVRYIRTCINEYLPDESIIHLAQSLRIVRKSSAPLTLTNIGLTPVTEADSLNCLQVSRKVMRNDELALLLYNLAPYALMKRKEIAEFAKMMFPNIFSSAATIYSTFTKFYAADGTVLPVPDTFSVIVMPDHSPATIENVCFELGSIVNQDN